MIGRLFNYVEIKTKITSVFPFFLTLAYIIFNGGEIKALETAVFFLGMLCFDLTATTINNYFDTKKNKKPLPFKRSTAAAITCLLFALSTVLGIWLAAMSGIVVLFLGMLCFAFGILYSAGPVPISHGPYGEVVSGAFYGMVIPFILIYINNPSMLLAITHTASYDIFTVVINTGAMLSFFLLSLVPFCLTAGIMLANNICDTEHDVAVGRFTLAYYLKRRAAVALFWALYYIAYASVVVAVILGYQPITCLGLLVTLPIVQKNLNTFRHRQVKEETFIVSIKNFLIIIITHTILLFAGILL